ncbi:MAG: VCBS repeat-containing protein [Acidobacteriota bacterium]|nr:VCBS repeat-containing protein [Acidobacteriota bacterium]
MILLPLLALLCKSYSFDAPRVYPHTSVFLRKPVIADFDGDGRNDLGLMLDGKFEIHYGAAGGMLRETQTIPQWIFGVADVAGDRLPDLDGGHGFLENLGSRTFAARAGKLPDPRKYWVGDFTGDGRNDIADTSTAAQLRLSERMPDDHFEDRAATNTGVDLTWAGAADVNGDHRAEMIGWDYNGGVRVFRLGANGTFALANTLRPSGFISAVTTADLDRDGAADVITSVERGVLEVFYANGRTAKFNNGNATTELEELHSGDVNGDGAVDLLVAHRGRYETTATVLLNDGLGALVRTPRIPIASENNIALGDLTGDGRADLALTTQFGLGVLPATQAGGFFTPTVVQPGTGDGLSHTAADFDGDGIDEIVQTIGIRVAVLWNDGHGNRRTEVFDHPFPGSVINLRVDGADIIAQYGTDLVIWSRRNGTWKMRQFQSDFLSSSHTADFDRDGLSEVVTVSLVPELGHNIAVRSGADGRMLFSTLLQPWQERTDFLLDDFTGDGIPDLALALSGTRATPGVGGVPLRNGSIVVMAGNARGELTRVAVPLTNQSPRTLTSGDFNGDGRRDLAFTTYDFDVRVLYGTPGGFTPQQIVAPGVYFAARDADGDGISELVVGHYDAFLLLRGTREGLVETGRWTVGLLYPQPVFAMLRPREAATLLLSTFDGKGAYAFEPTCADSRRRTVRH